MPRQPPLPSPPFFSSSAFGGISIEWRSHRAAWPASNGFSLSSCAHHPIQYEKFCCFPWKNTNTLTPFPNCEHLKKTSHTQLSNPKKGELKNIYKRFLVDLRYLSWLLETSWPFWPLIGRLLPEPRERKVVWTNWRSGDFPSEMIKMNHLLYTSPWLQNFERSKNGSECGDELIPVFMRYTTDFISVFGTCFHPPNKIDRFDWFTHLLLISEILHLRFTKAAVTNEINSSTHSAEGVCYIPTPYPTPIFIYLGHNLETGPISSHTQKIGRRNVPQRPILIQKHTQKNRP